MHPLSHKKLFLLDMDGTIYIGDKLISGALELIALLKNSGRDYIFMTNNSSKSAADYLAKLTRLGIPADISNILTSGQAAAIHLLGIKQGAKLYVIGTSSLKTELEGYGFKIASSPDNDVDLLLCGYDTELDYKKLTHACELLYRGVPFYATNPDVVCPWTKGRYLPDCATICYMLEKATGVSPFYIGKPRKEIALAAAQMAGVQAELAVVVGDRLYTDIACAVNAGMTSVLVLSGESTSDDIHKYGITPNYVVDSVLDLFNILLTD